jgi:hypothetical protein
LGCVPQPNLRYNDFSRLNRAVLSKERSLFYVLFDIYPTIFLNFAVVLWV